MKEGGYQPPEEPRRIVRKDVTEQQLLWVKQLSRACIMREEVAAADAELSQNGQPGDRVTLWTRVQPDVKPVYLRVQPGMTLDGVQHIITSRMEDLRAEGLSDVAKSIVFDGKRTSSIPGGTDVTSPRPDRTPGGYRNELRTLEQDAREDAQRTFRRDNPPHEQMGDAGSDLDPWTKDDDDILPY